MPHECDALSSVLGALSAAGNVFVTKPEQTVTLECGVNNFRGSLEWRRGDQRIFSVDGKTGFKRKGINRQTLNIIYSTTYCF